MKGLRFENPSNYDINEGTNWSDLYLSSSPDTALIIHDFYSL